MQGCELPDTVERALESILLLPAYEQVALRIICSPKAQIPASVTNHKELLTHAKGTMSKIPLISKETFGKFEYDVSEEAWLSRRECLVTFPMFKTRYRMLFTNGISDGALYDMFKTLPKGARVGRYMLAGLSTINNPKEPSRRSWPCRNEEVQVWINIEDETPLIY